MKLAICTAGVCGLALMGAGCGGDDDNDTLSYEDTGTEIGAVCADINALGNDLNGDPKNDAPILADIVPQFEDAVDEVRNLDVNEELASIRDDFVANGEEQVALIEEAQQAAEAGDKKAYLNTLKNGDAIDQESDELANQLGADECLSD